MRFYSTPKNSLFAQVNLLVIPQKRPLTSILICPSTPFYTTKTLV